jgi:hypothetical protein
MVRDLSAEEWSLPGRVLDLYLQVIQSSIGNIASHNATIASIRPVNTSIAFKFEFGLDGPVSATPTLKRDGSPSDNSLEEYIYDAALETLTRGLAQIHLIKGGEDSGEECTRYVLCPANLVPDTPFRIPMDGAIISIPRISFDPGIKIAQSRIARC